MKTLINKNNPQIRITAPEIGTYREFYTLSDKDFHYLFKMEDWVLVEEEPTCKTCGFYENNCPFIRGKFIVYPSRVCKDYIHSAMKEQKLNPSNSVGLEQKPAEWSKEDEDMYARIVRRYTDYEGVIMRTKEESVAAKILDAMAQEEIWLKSLRPQPKRKQSPALKKIVDNLTEEKLAKTRAEMKLEEQQMPDSTQLIAEWEKEKAMLEQKDFRGDAERMAYNAFLDGFIKGPNKIYVEVCEDGIFAFPEPPFKESVEYIRADLVDSLQQEQTEVDLEKEIDKTVSECTSGYNFDWDRFARHFYELGRKGGKI